MDRHEEKEEREIMKPKRKQKTEKRLVQERKRKNSTTLPPGGHLEI